MNKKLYKVLGQLCCLVLVLGLYLGLSMQTAKAATGYDVWVNGVEFTEENATTGINENGCSATYNVNTNTITLGSYCVISDSYLKDSVHYGIYSGREETLTIELESLCAMSFDESAVGTDESYVGIYTPSYLIIKSTKDGTGALGTEVPGQLFQSEKTYLYLSYINLVCTTYATAIDSELVLSGGDSASYYIENKGMGAVCTQPITATGATLSIQAVDHQHEAASKLNATISGKVDIIGFIGHTTAMSDTVVLTIKGATDVMISGGAPNNYYSIKKPAIFGSATIEASGDVVLDAHGVADVCTGDLKVTAASLKISNSFVKLAADTLRATISGPVEIEGYIGSIRESKTILSITQATDVTLTGYDPNGSAKYGISGSAYIRASGDVVLSCDARGDLCYEGLDIYAKNLTLKAAGGAQLARILKANVSGEVTTLGYIGGISDPKTVVSISGATNVSMSGGSNGGGSTGFPSCFIIGSAKIQASQDVTLKSHSQNLCYDTLTVDAQNLSAAAFSNVFFAANKMNLTLTGDLNVTGYTRGAVTIHMVKEATFSGGTGDTPTIGGLLTVEQADSLILKGDQKVLVEVPVLCDNLTDVFYVASDSTITQAYRPGLEAYQSSYAKILPHLSHVVTEVPAKSATCETEGHYKHYLCICGKVFADKEANNELASEQYIIQPLGHSYGTVSFTWTTDSNGQPTATATRICLNDSSHKQTGTAAIAKVHTAPTCEVAGSDVYTAKVVFGEGAQAETFTDENTTVIPATGHDFNNYWTVDETGHWYTCKNGCGAKGSYGAHKLGTYRDNEDATCDADGTHSAICAECSKMITTAVSGTALGHSWNDGAVTTVATYLKDGVFTYTCLRDSSHTKTEAIPALGQTDLSACTVKFSTTSYSYTGAAKKPTVTVMNGETVVAASNYIVTYSNNTKVGIANVTITAKEGDVALTGTAEATFTIKEDKYINECEINKSLSITTSGKSLKFSWGKVVNADGYDIDAKLCGSKSILFSNKAWKTIKGNSTTSVTISKIAGKALSTSKEYKVRVRAYRMVDGKKVYVATSQVLHIVFSANKKYTNPKSISVKSTKVSIAKGKTYTIKPTVKKVSTSKKLLDHTAACRYWSSDKKIATVSSSGKVKALGKGTCYIYVMAVNGVKTKVQVTVK